jgi:signal transduction histidine kinase
MMKASISKKYAAAFGAISLVVTAAITLSFITLLVREGYLLRDQVEQTEREIYEESQGKTQYNLTRYLSTYLFVPLYNLDLDDMNRLINDMRSTLPIESFLIADRDGFILLDGTKENASSRKRLEIDRRGRETVETVPNGRRITFAIKAGNHIAGYGQIVFSHAPLRSAITKHRSHLTSAWKTFTDSLVRISIAAFLIVLVLAAFLSFFFSRTLSRPLLALKQAADRVARGDLEHQVVIDSEDEIGELAAAFNRMVLDLKTSTDRLRDANDKLRTLDHLKSEFISVASHELRTPITSVKAFTELMLMRPAMSEDKKTKFLEVIKRESDRLARLINDILDITKIENGTLHWRISRLSMEEVIRYSLSCIEPLALGRNLSIEVSIEENLPAVSGDRDRLVQVVTNILSNAVKFTEISGAITVRACRDSGQVPAVTVEIADTGAGIPSDSLDLIFEKFHRAGDGLTNPVEGTGLGLAIARQIIAHHGGIIYARSRDEGGAVFTFTIPIEQGQKISKKEGEPRHESHG